MPVIDINMQIFKNIRSNVTPEMIDAINKSPILSAQVFSFNNEIKQNTAVPIIASNGGGSTYSHPSTASEIQIDINSRWAKGESLNYVDNNNVSHTISPTGAFIGLLSHELGHYNARSVDVALVAKLLPKDPTYIESRASVEIYSEGEAAFNNWAVRNQIKTAGGPEVEVIGSNYRYTETGTDNIYNNLIYKMDLIAVSGRNSGMSDADIKLAVTDIAASTIVLQKPSNSSAPNYWEYYKTLAGAPINRSPAQSVILEDKNHDGIYEKIIDQKIDGSLEISLNGSQSLAQSNATINIATGSNVVLTGSGIKANSAAGNAITIGGNGTYGTGNSNDTLTIVGNGSASVTIKDSSNVNVFMNGGTVNAGAGDYFGVYATGGANAGGTTITAGAGSNIWFGGNGSGGLLDKVTLAGGGVVTIADNSRGDIYNPNGTINAGQNDNFGAYGSGGTTVNANSSDGVWFGGNGIGATKFTINAGGATLAAADNTRADIFGSGNGTLFEGNNAKIINNEPGEHIYENGTGNANINRGENILITDNGQQNYNYNYAGGIVTQNYAYYDYTANLNRFETVFNNVKYDYYYNFDATDIAYNFDATDIQLSSPPAMPSGGFAFAGAKGANAANVLQRIDAIAAADLAKGNTDIASVESLAKEQIAFAMHSEAKVLFSGGRFDHRLITWSLDSQHQEFSGRLDTSDKGVVQQAFADWSKATGLTFQEARAGEKADIDIGWGDLATESTGAVGLTVAHSVQGHIQKGVVIRLEDKSFNALEKDAKGEFLYSGTDATFKQVITHEIGHALGLADTANASSIESFFLGADNREISQGDAEAVKWLYGTNNGRSPYISEETASLLAKMSAFAPATGATAVHMQSPFDQRFVAADTSPSAETTQQSAQWLAEFQAQIIGQSNEHLLYLSDFA
ncbi:matrixin family metalloprotease [Oxalobacteraceae bacterium]|nr:matrixin family metalloprotease [Oxalobacteraceae bacterium]